MKEAREPIKGKPDACTALKETTGGEFRAKKGFHNKASVKYIDLL